MNAIAIETGSDSTPWLPEKSRGQRVLLVDDAPANLELAATVLMHDGYEVFVADSGKMALAMAAEVRPDLILLDLMMPDLCGVGTCQQLKDADVTAAIPVIMLTACADDRQLLESFAVGAVDYVQKPFNPAVLLARVRTHVQLYRRTRELERLARVDALTGLPNRRAFEDRMAEEWQRARRAGTMLGLVLLDVDCFKQYNDSFGHPQGDAALQAVAAALQGQMRRAGDFCARYGGEEFAVLTACEVGKSPAGLAGRLGEAVRALAIPHRCVTGGVLTVSLGHSCVVPSDSLTPEQLVEAADRALYRAKANGRNQVEAGLIAA